MTDSQSEGPLRALLEQLAQQSRRIDNNRAASVILDLAVITLLVDKKLVTIEEVVERIDHLRGVLLPAEVYASQDTASAVGFPTGWLRAHLPQAPQQQRWQPEVVGGTDLDNAVSRPSEAKPPLGST